MNEVHEMVHALKMTLKQQRQTYADVAQHLDLSEASVKRMFSTHNFSLKRIHAICQILKIDMADLFAMIEKQRKKVSFLSTTQEQALVNDKALLLVALCVQNYFNFDDLITQFTFSKKQCFALLAQLDHIGIIELHANNRIKLLIAQDFRWLPDGPIEHFFHDKIQPEFMNYPFQQPNECQWYLSGHLSDASFASLQQKLHALAREFAGLQSQDANLDINHRHHIGLMVACRPWQSSIFKPWHRET